MKFEKSRAWLVVPALALLCIMAPTWWYPLTGDQSTFSLLAQTINRGGMPYRDAWDLKPPGIYLAYAFVTRFAPDGLALTFWIRAADILIVIAIGVLIALLTRRWGRAGSAWAAAAWYGALYLSGGFSNLAQTENWANPFIVAATLGCFVATQSTLEARQNTLSPETATARDMAQNTARTQSTLRGRALSWLALAALLAGIAVTFKFTAAFPVLPFLAWAVWRAPTQSTLQSTLSGTAQRAALVLIGLVLPLALACWWLQARGAWDEFLDIQRFVAQYASLGQEGAPQNLAGWGALGERLGNIIGYTAGWMELVWFPVSLALTGVLAGRGWREPANKYALIAFACGVFGVWLQNKFFGYHWLPALPALAILCACSVSKLLRLTPLAPRFVPAAGLVCALAWNLAVQWNDLRDAALLAANRLSMEKWNARFVDREAYSHSANLEVARTIRARTRPDETIMVWGFEPPLFVLSERRPASRFFLTPPLVTAFAPAGWRKEFLSDLRARPPRYFVVASRDPMPWVNARRDDSSAQLQKWPALRDWLAQNYQRETQIDDFTLHRRVDK